MNVERRGIVQGYTVLTGESVTENHPARGWVTDRFTVLRGEIPRRACLAERRRGRRCAGDGRSPTAPPARSSRVMDGLQVQWLLDEASTSPVATKFAIEAILVAAFDGPGRARPLDGDAGASSGAGDTT